MPYENGKWIPPEEFADLPWDDEDFDEHNLVHKLQKIGDLKEGENLSDLFDVGLDRWEHQSDWEGKLTPNKRFEILKLYSEDYFEGKTFEDSWGLEFERKGIDIDDTDGLWNAEGLYRALMGDGYDIDYAHYNNNLAYRSTVNKLGAEYGFADHQLPFTTVRQLRAAKAILDKPGYDFDEAWVKNHAWPYSDQELEALEDFAKHNPSRHFDPETNITTYMNPQDNRSLDIKLSEARSAGDYNRLKEPGSPQFLNVIQGDVPEAQYTAEGARKITDNDIRQIYQRYLGRDYNSADPEKGGITQEEIDHWQNQIATHKWSYDKFEQTIANHPDAKGHVDKGKAYFNPNYDKEEEYRNKLVSEPEAITTPPTFDAKTNKITLKRPGYLPAKQAEGVEETVATRGFDVKLDFTQGA